MDQEVQDGVIAGPGLRHPGGIGGHCEEDVCVQQEVLWDAEEGCVDGGGGVVLVTEVGRDLRADRLRDVKGAAKKASAGW